MKFALASLLLFAGAASTATPPPTAVGSTRTIYGVFFEIASDPTGKRLDVFKIESVKTFVNGRFETVAVEVPDRFVRAARAFQETKPVPPPGRSYFTYVFYDPARPDEPLMRPD